MPELIALTVTLCGFGLSPIWLSLFVSKEKAERYTDWFNDTLGA